MLHIYVELTEFSVIIIECLGTYFTNLQTQVLQALIAFV